VLNAVSSQESLGRPCRGNGGLDWSRFRDSRTRTARRDVLPARPLQCRVLLPPQSAFRVSSALHFSHAAQHDVLLLTPFAGHEQADAEFNRESVAFVRELPARTEPTQEYYAPYTTQAAWKVLRTIDWTHMHHEQTYDILADRDIPWQDKKSWTDRSVRYYLTNDVAFSPAPLEVTMHRAAVMMKPYFTLFRNYYPKSNNYFYAAHWWHPVIYEAQMLGGNDGEQEMMVKQTDAVFYGQVLEKRPQRMLLLREAAPRYARFSPESANIFDNLHMFHGITYDILAYEGWSIEQKRAELYRVIAALGYQPGDEALARKFPVPHPDMDPRVYAPWLKSVQGEMARIMEEMLDEMLPMMMPEGMTPEAHEKLLAQFRLKMAPGLQPGEHPGSLHDALKALMPGMRMSPGSMEPGATPEKMVEIMLVGWRKKYAALPEAEPMPMADIGKSFLLGRQRTLIQDAEFAVEQLVEVAVRALSPGVNDPFTAINCIDWLGAALSFLANRRLSSPLHHGGDGRLCVVMAPYTYEGILNAAFNPLRQHTRTNEAVVIRLMDMINLLAEGDLPPVYRDALARHACLIHEDAVGRLPDGRDRTDLEQRYQHVVKTMQAKRQQERTER
jgi:hypothetical protein